MKAKFLFIALVFIQCSHHSQTVTIDLQNFASGFSSPVEITHCGDSRLFIVEQGGIIRILNSDGTTNATPFLDITSLTNGGGEQGLLGLAFHPNYATNGYFYINYTNTGGNTVIARYSVNAGNPDIANNSGTTLLTVPQPYSNHNGGTLKFGSDGYLYIGMGDGGSGGDPENRAQNINELLGKMLRIDVNSGSPYGIPAGNPYVGIPGADEIWAIGLRNPWKFSFDRQNGDLWIADVGQGTIEEVNRAGANESGLNYGWRCYEGNADFNTAGCASQSTMESPLVVVDHSSGACSITGGYVYRGTKYPNFQGKYFFSDYCLPKIGMVDDVGSVTFSDTFSGNNFVTFGEDKNGEIYIGSISNGIIYKLIDGSLATTMYTKSPFKIYPNPAISEIFIQKSTENYPTEVKIFDLNGKLLLQQKTQDIQVNTIKTGGLMTGLYLMKIKNNIGITTTHKFAVK